MFGYVTIDKPELKVKDFITYKAYYCGLCKLIGREHTQLCRATLNYDCSFLYVLLSGLQDSRPIYKQERCPSRPFSKKPCVYDTGGEYAAAINVLLSVKNIEDAAADGSAKCKLISPIYRRVFLRAKQNYADVAKLIEDSLNELYKLESQSSSDIDNVSDVFAQLLGGIFKAPGSSPRAMYRLGYNIGRWIYLIDAYEDIEEDYKKKNYNPFICKFGEEVASDKYKIAGADAEFNLKCSLAGAGEAFSLLDMPKNKEIIENIIYSGMYKRTDCALKGHKPTKNSSKFSDF